MTTSAPQGSLKGNDERAVMNAATIHQMYRKIKLAIEMIDPIVGEPEIIEATKLLNECTKYMADWLGLGKPGMQER